MRDWRGVYRLQLGPGLDFRAAKELVPYIRAIGASHLYLSPSLQARRGSTHGYDVVDPTRISEDLGGEAAFRELCRAGLGVLLDIVPNHMATDEEQNRYWRDPELRRRFFDVDEATGRHRRFFTIDELGGLRQEDPDVFEETHRTVLGLVDEGLVDGLRIDHPDGLADPRGYLERLRSRGVAHVWVEKILERGERLRADWPVEGTVGYEFANDATALLVHPRGEEALTRLYQELTGERRSFDELAHACKLEVARADFQPEFERLRSLLDRPDLEEAAASLPVYRTYVEPWSGRVADEDRIALATVAPDLRRILLLEERGHDELVTRFQQVTGPVMAKGVEDTAFYRYHRLVALNEVGGDPGRFSLAVEDFHRANAERAERHPLHLLTAQTHDTKRSGDVRARIGALAGLAGEWRERVHRWHELTGGLDDPNEEYLLWQTLVGAWPISSQRLVAYMEKALREAGVTTSWVEPDEAHEARVAERCRSLYRNDAFREDLELFLARLTPRGRRAALAQKLLRLTVPGVPDIYQGDALETLSLVDPDNRRAVDWERRRRLLREVEAGVPPRVETATMHVLVQALALRARRPEAFAGGYEPVDAGPDVCAFRRGDAVAVAVPLRHDWDREAVRELLGPGRDLLPALPLLLVERERAERRSY